MYLLELVVLAIGLAMDAFAVAVAAGASSKNNRLVLSLKLGTVFGLFQALMPVVGWLAGAKFRQEIAELSYWVVSVLFCLIGLRIAIAGLKSDSAQKDVQVSLCETTGGILVMGLLTSIDALGAGFTISFLDTSLVLASVTIGTVTFIFSLVGALLGDCAQKKIGHKAQIAGGIVISLIRIENPYCSPCLTKLKKGNFSTLEMTAMAVQ